VEYRAGGTLRNYREIKPKSFARATFRNLALDVVSRLPGRDDLDRPRVHFLYLHHVLDDERENFGKILHALARSHSFLSYSEAVDRVRRGKIDKPFISISVDDGLKNCLRIADQLDQFGASGCFFVCPSMADNPSYETAKEFCNRQLSLPAAEFMN
jgi:hypothetical protein